MSEFAMIPKWVRRKMFRLAFRGCRDDNPDMLEYVSQTMDCSSLERKIRIERALMLDYYARRLRK